jgi:cation-transporting P-type ATPase 13A2
MSFLGLLIMENFLKPETTPTIQALQKANIKTIMATGDNGLTALSVGKQCKIIRDDVPIFLGEL